MTRILLIRRQIDLAPLMEKDGGTIVSGLL
jgi:hypothetical protein